MTLTPGVLRALSSWNAMIQRCYDPQSTGFADYGGRGILVCQRWLDPWLFIEDLGERPEGLSLGRIDNERGYEPGNCRWETRLQQNRNTRRNVFIDGETQSAVAERLGLSQATVMRRRKSGASLEKPANFRRNKLDRDQVAAMKAEFSGPRSNVDIAKQFDVSHTLVAQIRRGRIWADVHALHTMARLQLQQAEPTLEWD
jgi:hypothetical protein